MTATEQLAGILASALEQQTMPIAKATPHQASTAAAPEQADLAVAMRAALAEMMCDPTDRAELAARIRHVADQIAVSLLAQVHTVVDAA